MKKRIALLAGLAVLAAIVAVGGGAFAKTSNSAFTGDVTCVFFTPLGPAVAPGHAVGQIQKNGDGRFVATCRTDAYAGFAEDRASLNKDIPCTVEGYPGTGNTVLTPSGNGIGTCKGSF